MLLRAVKKHVGVEGALKFMKPVNEQEGLFPNRHQWRSFLGDNLLFHIHSGCVSEPTHTLLVFSASVPVFCFLQRLHRVWMMLRLDVCSLFEVQPAGNGAWRSLSLEIKKRRTGHGWWWRTRCPFPWTSSLQSQTRSLVITELKTKRQIRHWLLDLGNDLFVVACQTSAAPLRLRPPAAAESPTALIYLFSPAASTTLPHPFTVFARKVEPVTCRSLVSMPHAHGSKPDCRSSEAAFGKMLVTVTLTVSRGGHQFGAVSWEMDGWTSWFICLAFNFIQPILSP